MRKSLRNILVMMLVFGICLSFIGMATADEPSYGTITVTPIEPTRQSDVTFTVEITGDDITEVNLRIQECTVTDGTEACSSTVLNVSMTNTVNNTWTGSTTLEWQLTTISHCWLEINSNGTWYDDSDDETKWTDFTVIPDDGDDNGDNGDTGGDDSDDTGGTPGFELIFVLISVLVVLFIYKKKRIR